MKIIWSNFAIGSLSEIYLYYKTNASISVAQRIKKDIFNATKQLKHHPLSGQIEPILEKRNQQHRYLVCGNYKIIYRKIPEGILITDVFDTRQNPDNINDENRKTRP